GDRGDARDGDRRRRGHRHRPGAGHPQEPVAPAAELAIDPLLVSVIAIIAVALIFDFLNGFHDAANSVATVVSTGTLTPNVAVAWAAFFNFVAAFGFGVKVAATLGKGVVDAAAIDRWVVLGGLAGAITWNLVTW